MEENQLERVTERELLIAIVMLALDEPEEFGTEDVLEILVSQGRDDIRQEAAELREIEGLEEDDEGLPEDDPEPEPEDITFTEQNFETDDAKT